MIPLIDLQAQFRSIEKELLQTIQDVIQTGQYILGPQVKLLETSIASRLNVAEAISVANGTEALTLTLESFQIGAGDEVITSPFTFIATAEAISRVGATPVFADVDADTGLLDPEAVERCINPKTKAIIPVHLFGQSCDMDALNTIAKAHQLIVIEDACQAFGATYKEKAVGSLGDAACFSFFPTKNLGGLGDGGMIVTNHSKEAARIRQLRVHGSTKKYYHHEIGYNSRLDTIQAAILLVCLNHVDDWNEKRRDIASVYNQAFQANPTLSPPKQLSKNQHIYHLYCLQSPIRDHYIQQLKRKGIASAIYYPVCLHEQEAYQFLHYKKGDFPNAEALTEKIFAIPMHPFLTTEEQQTVITAMQEVHCE